MREAMKAAAFAAAAWVVAPASAADIPTLVGEWSGTAEAVVIGSGGYRPGTQTLKDPPFTDQRAFNYSIKGQDGRRFWGEIKSADRIEPLAGALSLDGKTAYGADTDGHFHFTVRSAREMELC
ncbi:MAG TPA: hypothetical protein VFR71_00455 [Methyloceanibacter sp.]|nr:hypothetical protein [Methyloceanibacter sp.]